MKIEQYLFWGRVQHTQVCESLTGGSKYTNESDFQLDLTEDKVVNDND